MINAVGLEDYVRGVVALESPSSWPLEALKAQAVAARTYAITTNKPGAGFDHYADTRSQVYGGVGAEAAPSNEAVRQTRGQLVTYEGEPVTTYFFSTSGGRTENVETSALGTRPLPWLRSVRDPFDAVSPHHRWGPIRMSLGEAGRKLRGLVRGSFRGVDVISRGRSPRIVAADVVGSGGRTRVTGATLRARLELRDTWAYFTSVSMRQERPDRTDRPERTDETGGASASASRTVAARWSLTGSAFGVRRGRRAVAEIRTMVGWRRAGTAKLDRDGSFRFGLCARGAYRVRFGRVTGPVVDVR